MQPYLTLTRRELAAFFLSFTGYVIIAATTFLVGLSFVVLLLSLGNDPSPMPVTEIFFVSPWFGFWPILVLTTPVITMRLLALERFSGTFETLMTTPVRDVTVVLAKFSAALAFFLVIWLPMLACLFVVQSYARQSGALEPRLLLSLYLGIGSMGALFLSLGCFASALTRSQVVAAMVTFALGVSLFALGFLADRVEPGASWQSQVLSHLALFDQMHGFARGVVDTRAVVLHGSLTFFFLFLTLRAVENRRWR